MTAFEAVLFDCDGVLVDSESITNRVLCTMLNESGWPISTEECLREFIGKTVRSQVALIEARTELQRAIKQLKLRRDAVRAYEKQGLAQIAPLNQMAQDAYKLGQGSILELIDSLGSINEHRLEHLDLVKEMMLAEWQVRVASGDLPMWAAP